MEVLLSVLATPILFLIYYVLRRTSDSHQYWHEKDIPVVDEPIPFFGNIAPLFFFKKSLTELLKSFYDKSSNSSMVGFYYHGQPCLLLRDPELVKNITGKKFVNFSGNDAKSKNDETDQINFSTDITVEKMRIVSITVKNVLEKCITDIDNGIKKNRGSYEIDGKFYFTIFTAELIVGTCFGMCDKSFDDCPYPSSFQAYSQLNVGNYWINKLRIVLLHRKFANLIKEIIAAQVESKSERRSLLRSSVQTLANKESEVTSDNQQLQNEVDIHIVPLLLDLYDTLSITFVYLMYHLAIHKAIQEKVRQEIRLQIENNGNESSADILANLIYTEQVIYESARLLPAFGFLCKTCKKECQLDGFDGLSCWVETGTKIFVSVHGIHADPKYWTNYNKFDPDRFNKDPTARENIYLGFGKGPKIRPARKLALFLIKMTLCTLLLKYSVELSSKANLPFQSGSFLFQHFAKDGVWLVLRALNSR